MKNRSQQIGMFPQIHTYRELLQQIHDDLRFQHPEWVESNGESPICDSYEARLKQQLEALMRRGAKESIIPLQSVTSVDSGMRVEVSTDETRELRTIIQSATD